nr:hypothetical protein [Heyndrickxia oleronia]
MKNPLTKYWCLCCDWQETSHKLRDGLKCLECKSPVMSERLNEYKLKAISPSRYYPFVDVVRHLKRGGLAYLHYNDRIYRFSNNKSIEDIAKIYELDMEVVYTGNWQLMSRNADSVYEI